MSRHERDFAVPSIYQLKPRFQITQRIDKRRIFSVSLAQRTSHLR